MKIPFSPPDITEKEIEQVSEALRSGWITTGPKTKELERRITEFIGVPKVACLNSATAALELTLRILGIGPGDEVIVPAYTYTATASVVDHVGAKIVMIDSIGAWASQGDASGARASQGDASDVGPQGADAVVGCSPYEMNYDLMAEAITERTKAIIPVDIAGRACNYDRIIEIVESKKNMFRPGSELQEKLGRIAIVADGAHSFGASRLVGRPENYGLLNDVVSNADPSEARFNSGQLADFTCFSFHAVKNFTTAEGGAATWRSIPGVDDDWLYNQYMLASLHGQNKDALAKTKVGAWEYDIVYPAYKCNMTDIQGAIGLAQLDRYPEMLNRRREIIEKYDEAYVDAGLEPLIHFDNVSASSGHLYMLRLPDVTEEERNRIIEEMGERDVACNVHYKPLPLLTAYKNLGFDIANYPGAFDLYQREITLPLWSKMTDEEVDYVIDSFLEILARHQR